MLVQDSVCTPGGEDSFRLEKVSRSDKNGTFHPFLCGHWRVVCFHIALEKGLCLQGNGKDCARLVDVLSEAQSVSSAPLAHQRASGLG